jgi:hypothetical protein
VFISNMASGHDYSSASKFGAVRPITSGNYPIYKTERLLEEIVTAVLEASPEDYLLFSGSSVVAALCAVVWVLIHQQARILLWDRGARSYVLREINRDSIKLLIERIRLQGEEKIKNESR